MSDPDSLEPPLDVLAAWHRRGQGLLEPMRRLARRSSVAAVDAATRQQADAIVDWFDRCISVHYADEERDLFPALIESMAGSDPVCLRELIDGLRDDHDALASAWRDLRPSFAALAAGSPSTLDSTRVDALIARGERLFRREDQELLPMASRLLSDEARQEILASMLERRRRAAP